ncbi:MAG: hypothetical protein KGP28_01300 [Bdellovibrionales bacterium]|nr:hypothetical protein [Bdellovibrionales bacterium]
MIQSWARTPAALLVLLLFYSFFLWKFSIPMTGDQKVYLTVAMEMREKGEWLIPHLFGKPNFLKPPLQYWCTILGWNVFGFGLFGALIPSVIAMIAAGFLVKRISNSKTWIPCVFFGSTLASMTYGTTAQMEIWIVLFYLLSWHLILSDKPGLALTVVGIMSWIKGPLYSVLWGLGWILHEVVSGRWQGLYSWKTISRVTFGCAVGLSWFFLAGLKFPDEVLGVFLKRENIEKLNTPLGSPTGLWFEFLVTLWPLLPWLMISLLCRENRRRIAGKGSFYLCFALFPALFFTFFPYRVGTYLYILTPLMIWWMSERPVSPQAGGLRVVLTLVVFTAALLALFLVRLSLGHWISPLLAVFALASTAFWVFAHLRLNSSLVGLASLLLVSAVRLGGVELGSRDLEGLRIASGEGSTPIAYLMEGEDIWHEVGLVSSALGRRISLLREQGEIQPFLKSGGKMILAEEQLGLGEGLICRDWSRLKRRMKFPLRELIVEGLDYNLPKLHRTFRICWLPET